MAEEDKKEETVMVVPSESAAEIKIHAEAVEALTVEAEPIPESKDLVVVASNPQQMQVAQRNLVQWTQSKQKVLEDKRKEAQENLDIATKNKWRTATLRKIVRDYTKEIEFHVKLETALVNGYVIIPNFEDIDIFAIRTMKRKPKANTVVMHRYRDSTRPVPNAQQSEEPPVGEGRFVDADASPRYSFWENTKAGEKPQRMVSARADEFKNIDFPFLLAKPEILAKTGAAMKHLCFDDIGIIPGRAKSRRRGDPMIIGRIHMTKASSFRCISFLITWFVNTEDL